MTDTATEPPPDAAHGTLFVVCAPSGAGKTTLVRALARDDPLAMISVSHTTRSARDGEVDGEHYFFVSEERFMEMIDAGAFLEHALVFGARYGTSREAVEANLADGRDVILEIDWQGTRQVREQMRHCVGIFILPPSRTSLEQRLRHRAQDSNEVIARRMREAVEEMSHWDEFDYVIFNDDFDTALADLRAVLMCERLRRERQGARHRALIRSMLAQASG
jgi:guanylate kinase